MPNLLEDQKNELEALESIYSNELEIIELEPYPKFSIKLSTDDYQENKVRLTVKIEFTFNEKYPDDLPKIEIIECADYFREEFKPILEHLILEEANKNLGMVMIFSLVSFVNEWLSNKMEELKEELRIEQENKFKKLEEIEQKKFDGTKVTLEGFMHWKLNFDKEMKKFSNKDKVEQNKKLNGRQLFEKDASLFKSDLEFIKDEEAVCVDESLFDELNDLDLDDDSDYEPLDSSSSD